MFIFFLCDSVACDGCSAMCEVNSNEQKHMRWGYQDIRYPDVIFWYWNFSDTELSHASPHANFMKFLEQLFSENLWDAVFA